MGASSGQGPGIPLNDHDASDKGSSRAKCPRGEKPCLKAALPAPAAPPHTPTPCLVPKASATTHLPPSVPPSHTFTEHLLRVGAESLWGVEPPSQHLSSSHPSSPPSPGPPWPPSSGHGNTTEGRARGGGVRVECSRPSAESRHPDPLQGGLGWEWVQLSRQTPGSGSESVLGQARVPAYQDWCCPGCRGPAWKWGTVSRSSYNGLLSLE